MLAIIENSVYDAVFDMCGYVESDLEYAVDLFGSRTKKYVFISTAATYLEPLVMPITETHTQGAHGVWGKYGSGKLACEQLLLSAYEASKFPAVIVRPSYVYGIGNTIDRETFLFDRITEGRTILVPRYGEAVIQLGEVSDLCRALLMIAEEPKGYGECYNISGHELVTINSLVRLVASIMRKDFKAAFVTPRDHGMTDRDVFPFDCISYFTSSEKFCSDFGWSPQTSLADGLTDAYEDWLHSTSRLSTNYDKEDVVLAGV
jgi:nucleoside-diphosphate-sugar epimerase